MKSCPLGLIAFMMTYPGFAGSYATLGLRSAQFASKPLIDEPTPNYYAYGPKLSLGYSVRQVLDLGLFVTALPGSRHQASIPAHDARLVSGGAEMALRIAQSVYVALYGGRSEYRMIDGASGAQRGLEIRGRHLGQVAGLSLGALVPLSKESFFQVSLDFEEHHLKLGRSYLLEGDGLGSTELPSQQLSESQSGPDKDPRRVLECFGVSISYAFNSYQSTVIDNSFFSDFLDSVSF